MAKSRLKLDWKLSTTSERSNFIKQYTSEITFVPNDEELEMMANYVLWGKDEDGKNGVQKGEYEIETKFKAWDKKETASLDELQESPGFNEALLKPITPGTIVPKITRKVFDREEALARCNPSLRSDFIDLFQRIDETDLLVELYELEHGKRTKPIRDSLWNRIQVEDIDKIRTRAAGLNQRQYLQQKHELVELRSQQYTLAESYAQGGFIQHDYRPQLVAPLPRFDADIPVYPLGFMYQNNNLIFFQEDELCGHAFTEKELKLISNLLVEHKDDNQNSYFLDFTDMEHVYNLLLMKSDIEYYAEIDDSTESTTKELLDTINFYIEFAELSELQQEILDLKIQKVKNPDIAKIINEKYNKSYTANYISTIFRQKIIKQINEGAEYHLRLVENLFYPENFKECNCCGKTYLIDQKNFVRKTRAKDGYANRCKKCDRNDRERRKEN